MGFSYQLHIQNFALESDPVAKVLSAWCTKPGSNVGKLLDIIEKIERHDVLHELPAFLGEKMEKWYRLIDLSTNSLLYCNLSHFHSFIRCNKMLVILSPEFLQSPSCDFQTKFAVSLEPGARKRRIIPILVKPCERPLIIQHINLCDFTKQDIRSCFWARLRKAMSIR
eukprot:XP_011675179.1 PREDICTED: myeloid differentiation primary response protein MyD88-like [Strongylocentrotus purpuratus]